MDKKIRLRILDQARRYLHSGWHCSESILMAAGKHYFPEKIPELIKVATPFSGGVGNTEEELCGAFTGGLMVLGSIYGRTSAGINDNHCIYLAKQYREEFLNHFGYLRCKDLREKWIGKPGQPDCAELTAQAAGMLLDLLE